MPASTKPPSKTDSGLENDFPSHSNSSSSASSNSNFSTNDHNDPVVVMPSSEATRRRAGLMPSIPVVDVDSDDEKAGKVNPVFITVENDEGDLEPVKLKMDDEDFDQFSMVRRQGWNPGPRGSIAQLKDSIDKFKSNMRRGSVQVRMD